MGVMTGCVTDDDDDGKAASGKSSSRTQSEPAKDWQAVVDTAEMMGTVEDIKTLWTKEGVSKAPKAVQDKIKTLADALKFAEEA
jgi:hypothetical protein